MSLVFQGGRRCLSNASSKEDRKPELRLEGYTYGLESTVYSL